MLALQAGYGEPLEAGLIVTVVVAVAVMVSMGAMTIMGWMTVVGLAKAAVSGGCTIEKRGVFEDPGVCDGFMVVVAMMAVELIVTAL